MIYVTKLVLIVHYIKVNTNNILFKVSWKQLSCSCALGELLSKYRVIAIYFLFFINLVYSDCNFLIQYWVITIIVTSFFLWIESEIFQAMPSDNSSSGRWQWKQSQFPSAVHRVFLSLKHVQTLHRHLTKYSILWFQFFFFSVEILSQTQDLVHCERLLIHLIKSFQKNTWDQVVFALLVCAQLCISAFLG